MSGKDSSRRIAALVNRVEGAEFTVAAMRGTKWEQTMAAGRYAAAVLALHGAVQYTQVPQAARGFYGADRTKIENLKQHLGSMTRVAVIRRMVVLRDLMVAHQEALENNKFEKMEKAFDRYIRMERRECERLARILPDIDEPIDVLLDRHVPGLRYRHLAAIQRAITPVCMDAQYQQSHVEPDLRFILSHERQKKLGNLMMDRMGLDRRQVQVVWGSGRPMIRGHGADVKLVVRWRGVDFTWMVMDLVHEAAGHGVYRQSEPRAAEWRGTCAGMVPDAMADEVPALMIEHFIARSRGFAGFLHKAMTDADVNPNNLTADDIFRRMQVNARGTSRVEADLKTYPLHTMQRIRLVRELISGCKEAADFPRLWKWLDADFCLPYPRSDIDGIMGDVQMFTGYMGYFGAYLPALMAAANAFEKMGRDVPDWERRLGEGDFEPVRKWMKAHIHDRGGTFTPDTDPAAFVRHMSAKYSPRPRAGFMLPPAP